MTRRPKQVAPRIKWNFPGTCLSLNSKVVGECFLSSRTFDFFVFLSFLFWTLNHLSSWEKGRIRDTKIRLATSVVGILSTSGINRNYQKIQATLKYLTFLCNYKVLLVSTPPDFYTTQYILGISAMRSWTSFSDLWLGTLSSYRSQF